MTDNKSSQTLNPIQRIALALFVAGKSSERIDRAIIDQRAAEKRERVRLKQAQRRLAQKLKTGRMVQQ